MEAAHQAFAFGLFCRVFRPAGLLLFEAATHGDGARETAYVRHLKARTHSAAKIQDILDRLDHVSLLPICFFLWMPLGKLEWRVGPSGHSDRGCA
ncbi:hypothetical protein [Hydrogenophaga sp. BPS33]|uniref:hypothetical protein n=1 Tax=Hydrogenophaga sp. BPS33 TaxID=2651974 RepID=UPI00131FD7F8|nr:hypothetical protein [Hydrogenophaga sp. BPS33]QHE88056.1 hypothetical protein F9K07_25760 [Hydrogenophaga sp. BPS33]